MLGCVERRTEANLGREERVVADEGPNEWNERMLCQRVTMWWLATVEQRRRRGEDGKKKRRENERKSMVWFGNKDGLGAWHAWHPCTAHFRCWWLVAP